MPDGGSDCCGTCWFNTHNKGEAGYGHARDDGPNFCTIRGLPIRDPFWTYCGNHPYRCPDKDPIPIGPVFVADGPHGGRKLWESSPDTEEVRAHLLELLDAIVQRGKEEYPHGVHTDELVVWQLGEFRELRALAALHRIAAFRSGVIEGLFGRSRASLVAMAKEALVKIQEQIA